MHSLRVLIPPVGAMMYPVAVVGLYHEAAAVRGSSGVSGSVTAEIEVLAMAAATLWPSVTGVMLAVALGRGGFGASSRWLAHLVVATPPLYNIASAVIASVGLAAYEFPIWALGWSGVALGLWATSRTPTTQAVEQGGSHRRTPLRFAHGVGGAVLLGSFLLPHLSNHLVALWSVDANRAMMDVIRRFYRHPVVEPLLLALFGFQILSGGRLLVARLRRPQDAPETLLTTSAAYMAVFIVGHTLAVFIFGRQMLKVDTDWSFASGGEAGLFGGAWPVRLVPYYFLGMVALPVHGAVGVRLVMLARGCGRTVADGVGIGIAAAGVFVAILVTAALLGVRLAPIG